MGTVVHVSIGAFWGDCFDKQARTHTHTHTHTLIPFGRTKASTTRARMIRADFFNFTILPVVAKDLTISHRFTPLQFSIAMQVQHSYNSSANGWILLTHAFDKNRTHDFRTTSRCAGYLLDHSGDEGCAVIMCKSINTHTRTPTQKQIVRKRFARENFTKKKHVIITSPKKNRHLLSSHLKRDWVYTVLYIYTGLV